MKERRASLTLGGEVNTFVYCQPVVVIGVVVFSLVVVVIVGVEVTDVGHVVLTVDVDVFVIVIVVKIEVFAKGSNFSYSIYWKVCLEMRFPLAFTSGILTYNAV